MVIEIFEGKITLFAQWRSAYIPRDTLDCLNNDCLIRAVSILGINLPNCTTYALARALEITNNDPKLSPLYETPSFIVPGHSDAVYWW